MGSSRSLKTSFGVGDLRELSAEATTSFFRFLMMRIRRIVSIRKRNVLE
jgi:hypothetical protein